MKSFTLIELLVSVSIVVILSAMLLLSPRRSSEPFELANAAQKFVSDIQRVQGFALATRDFGGSSIPAGGGWGIYLQENKRCYVIFADAGIPNKRYDPSPGDLCDTSQVGGELLERVFLPHSVSFRAGSFTPAGLATIIFLPPRPNVTFSDSAGNVLLGPSASVTLELKSIGNQKTITVNTVGNASVN